MVKNNNFLQGVLAVMLLASPLAGAETQYPASDFKPKVVYNDPEYKHAESAAPAASVKKAAKADPRYPAADFQPKVLYKDTGYKHKADVVASAPKSTASTSAAKSQPAAESAQEGSDNTMLIGLIVLAAVGFYFLKGKKGTPAQTTAARPARRPAPVQAGEEGGLTGVAKYLAGKETAVTGVAKYLEAKEQEAPVTGVAKYMAKQVVAARQAAAERVTGVEKYLRNKG